MNLAVINAANVFGFALLAVVFVCNLWRRRERSRENNILLLLIFVCMFSCIADSVSYSFDGVPGSFAHAVEYVSSAWLFAGDVICACLWLLFIAAHLRFKFSQLHAGFLIGLVGIAVLALVGNLFAPIAFYLDDSNVYHRTDVYYLFVAICLIVILDSVAIYTYARSKGGVLKLFPVWVYVIPIVFGATVQTFFYGISLIHACSAIAITGILASLQNELMFRDKLTGLYNRFYLDNTKERLRRSKKSNTGAMMIDLNGFKQINDSLGHAVGDQALKDVASILSDVVGTAGSVIRYAGDEFVVLINTASQEIMNDYVAAVQKGFDDFNKGGKRPYELSVSIGAGIFDLRAMSVDEMMNEIDSRMYKTKREYYLTHDRRQD